MNRRHSFHICTCTAYPQPHRRGAGNCRLMAAAREDYDRILIELDQTYPTRTDTKRNKK